MTLQDQQLIRRKALAKWLRENPEKQCKYVFHSDHKNGNHCLFGAAEVVRSIRMHRNFRWDDCSNTEKYFGLDVRMLINKNDKLNITFAQFAEELDPIGS